MFRIGSGIDIHKFSEDRDLILGGVKIPHEKGLLGHSDADVLIHAVMDALLGALALGDIGKLFPDTDDEYKDIDSRILLSRVVKIMKEKDYKIVNLDANIACQRPKLRNYIDLMRENLAEDLDCDVSRISVKATTTEKLGFVGREEGIFTNCTVLLENEA